MTTETEIRAAIESPHYAYSRAGDRLFRGTTMIYHWVPESPTGVHLACVGDAKMVDFLIRSIRNNSPLSPMERYR